jgi:hypothetical protein
MFLCACVCAWCVFVRVCACFCVQVCVRVVCVCVHGCVRVTVRRFPPRSVPKASTAQHCRKTIPLHRVALRGTVLHHVALRGNMLHSAATHSQVAAAAPRAKHALSAGSCARQGTHAHARLHGIQRARTKSDQWFSHLIDVAETRRVGEPPKLRLKYRNIRDLCTCQSPRHIRSIIGPIALRVAPVSMAGGFAASAATRRANRHCTLSRA